MRVLYRDAYENAHLSRVKVLMRPFPSNTLLLHAVSVTSVEGTNLHVCERKS